MLRALSVDDMISIKACLQKISLWDNSHKKLLQQCLLLKHIVSHFQPMEYTFRLTHKQPKLGCEGLKVHRGFLVF